MAGVGAIILAAGLSSRMVENKLLLPWTDDQPIICHVLDSYVAAQIAPIVVVTGRDAEAVTARLADYPLTFVHNPEYSTGEMLSSVKVGLRALPHDLDASFIQPADMPCISRDVIAQLAAQHEKGINVAPLHKGRRGHPVLLDRAFWRDMLALPADAMPRAVIQGSPDNLRLVPVADKGVVMDVDTREAYQRVFGISCNR